MPDSSITLALLVLFIFFSAFQQTLTGFGFALFAMPIATFLLGMKTAAPLVALVAISLYVVNFLRYRHAINLREFLRLGVAAALGVPIGIWAFANVSEAIIKLLLGVILIGYALYSLVKPSAHNLRVERWVYVVGFLTGCLGGAYNTPGPPVVIYGSLREWDKDEFRAVLQAIFLLTASLSVASHFITQHVTTEVLALYAISAPALIIGVWAGAHVDSRVDKNLFRAIVTVMVLLVGASLIIDAVLK